MVAGSSTIFPASSKNQIQQVEKIIKHPDHAAKSVDLAILVLKQKFIFNKNVNKISLNIRGQKRGDFLSYCVTYGWGKKSKKGIYELSGAKLSMTNINHCIINLPKAAKTLRERKDLICTKSPKDVSICTGDFGAPLLCRYRIGKVFQTYLMGTAIKLSGDYDCRQNRKKEAVYETMQDRLNLKMPGHIRWLKKTMDKLQNPNVERSSSKMDKPKLLTLLATLFTAKIAAIISQ